MSRKLKLLTFVCGSFLLLVTIQLLIQNGRLSSRIQLYRSSQGVQSPIKLDLDTFARLAGIEAPFSVLQPRRRLVLVAGVDCQYSAANVGSWERLIGEVDWSQGQEALIVVSGGPPPDAIIHALELSGAPFRTAEISDPVAFAVQTGVSQTPFTFVLDAAETVSVACQGAIDRPEIDVFREALNRAEPATGTRHLISKAYTGSTRLIAADPE